MSDYYLSGYCEICYITWKIVSSTSSKLRQCPKCIALVLYQEETKNDSSKRPRNLV